MAPGNDNVRFVAVRALRAMGEAAQEQAPLLCAVLKDPYWRVLWNGQEHTVSDEFVTLLEARRGAEQAQLAPSPELTPTGT